MFSFLFNFFSKFTWKQNLIFLSIFTTIVTVIGLFSYYIYKKNSNNDYLKYRINNNFNKAYKYLKNNDYIDTKKFPYNIIEEKAVKSIREKYSSYISDDFFIKNKFEKIKRLEYNKTKNLKIRELGTKALGTITKKLFIGSCYIDDGALLILDDDLLYVDIYMNVRNEEKEKEISLPSSFIICIIFLPFEKTYYPNSFFSCEEEFMIYKNNFVRLINKARMKDVYIIQVPEKIYNLSYSDSAKEWEYVEKYNEEEERAILSDENIYLKFLCEYFNTVTTKQNPIKDFKEGLKGNKCEVFI